MFLIENLVGHPKTIKRAINYTTIGTTNKTIRFFFFYNNLTTIYYLTYARGHMNPWCWHLELVLQTPPGHFHIVTLQFPDGVFVFLVLRMGGW